MKQFDWDNEKNRKLIEEREISFEEIVFFIEQGNLLDIISNPNTKKYRNQKMFVVEVNGYVYLVPFTEEGHRVFLKTIYPSRKATAKYLKGGGDHD